MVAYGLQQGLTSLHFSIPCGDPGVSTLERIDGLQS